MKILTRWQVLRENLESLIKDLFNDGAIADLDDTEKAILTDAKWIVPSYTRYRFTSQGKKGFLKALKLAYKLKGLNDK